MQQKSSNDSGTKLIHELVGIQEYHCFPYLN